MSFQFNSDREKIIASKPSLIGKNELTIRSGTGSIEKEVLRIQLGGETNLPRVGINRTGNRLDTIKVTNPGFGYTLQPVVTIGAPPIGGVQALAQAVILDGFVLAIAIDNIGSGYTTAPSVTITGGNGQGAAATAFLDTVDFELDINGAIRTSTSIISDTARILNLDIDNFVTPDLQLRGPNFKTYMNNGGTPWSSTVIVQKGSYRFHNQNVYEALNTGTTSAVPPQHTDGIELSGTVQLKHIGIRTNDPTQPYYNQGGETGIFPRSITAPFGDRTDKIATTEYVLNLATNDVGGRIYVSEQIGNDLSDGRSAVNPVRSIKRAAQLAWATPGVKETLVISGGEYLEDNPISLPPDCSVVGDNLRLVIIRPNNPRKHIFKFGDKNYVTGVTYRDKIDSNGDPIATWDFAMVFDDKQRLEIDYTTNGDADVNFPVGHQIFGPEKFRATFTSNTGLTNLSTSAANNLPVRGVNTGATGRLTEVVFVPSANGTITNLIGTVDFAVDSGSFTAGETFQYGGNDTKTFAPFTSYVLGDKVWTGDNVYTVTTAGSTQTTKTAENVVYNPVTGVATFTITGHGYGSGTQIKLVANSLTFTCGSDNDATTHTYPRTTDPAFDTPLTISSITTNTFNVNLGISPNTSTHSFVSATADGVLSGSNAPSNTAAGSTATSGSVVFTFLRIAYEFISTDIQSIRAEGEVVSVDYNITSALPISRIDFSKQGTPEVATGGFGDYGSPEDLGGIVFYTNELVGRQNTHNFKEGQEIFIAGLPTSGPDLSFLNGKQRIYKVIEDADGRARRFVIPKKSSETNDDFGPGQFAQVQSYSKSITLSLLNTPNKFPVATPVARRFQDACLQIRNNVDFIADEVTGRVNSEFKKEYYPAYSISGNDFKVFLGTSTFIHEYVSGGKVTLDKPLTPTAATYIPTTGVLTLTVNGHGITDGDTIKLLPGSLVFTCGSDGNVAQVAYPRSSDTTFTLPLEVSNVTANTFEVNVGLSSNTTAHTFVPSETKPGAIIYGAKYVISGFVYDNSVTGQATITTTTPVVGLVDDAIIKLSDILVKCTINGVITQKIYPSFSIPVSDEKCRRDVRHFVNSICRDLEYGSNYNTIDAAKKYISGTGIANYIDYEIIQTVRAFEYTRELCIYAMRKWRTGTGKPGQPVYTPLYSSITRYFDPSVLEDLTGGATQCANVASAINTLSYLFVDVLANNTSGTLLDAAWLIARNRDLIADEAYLRTKDQFPLLGLTNLNESKCRRDINRVISGVLRDICLGGNAGVVDAAETYFTGGVLTGVPEAQRPGTLYAFTQVRNLTIKAIRNWSDGNVTTTTPSSATYNDVTGAVTVTFPNPSTPVTTAHRIAFKEGALTFSCNFGGGVANHSSPTKNDRNYGRSLQITAVTSGGGNTTVSVNVGDAGTGTGAAHSFVSALAGGTIIVYDSKTITPTNVVYTPTTGDTVVTAPGHGLANGAKILVEPYSWKFTCALDSHATQHAYPRPYKSKTPTAATYIPTTGVLTLTVNGHGLAVGSAIKLLPNSLIFTCARDNYATQHSYPRVTDKNYDLDLRITATTTNTITVNVGISSDTSTHSFVSASVGAITYGTPDPIYNTPVAISGVTTDTFTINVGVSSDTSAHKFVSSTVNSVLPVVTTKTPTGAAYDPTTGLVTFTVANHGLTTGDRIVLNQNSLSYTCALDNNATTHTYPRVPTVSFKTPSTVAYNHTTGLLTFTVANHGIPTGGEIVIAPNSLTFTCASDGNVSQHTYPRVTDTTAYFKRLKVTNTGTDTFTVNVGVASVSNQYAHQFVSAETGSVGYTSNDPAYKRTLNVTGVPTANTFTVNAGVSSDTSAHIFTGATADAINYYPSSNTLSSPIPKFEDWNILLSTGGILCAPTAAAITTSYGLLADILSGTTNVGTTTRTYGTLYDTNTIRLLPTSTIYDADGVVITPRSDYDDYPIIEASPYTQNASVISFLGGGGALIDGSKVKQPNCPFPGLELPRTALGETEGRASFPNQGKSMVAAAFTIVSFGGTGYKIINDGYCQLVSVFVLFCQDGVLAESGGYASITNSATNFGKFALRAVGFNSFAYPFDVGRIESISSTPTGRTIFRVEDIGREPLEHYVIKIDGYRNTDPNVEYHIDVVEEVTANFNAATITIDSGSGGPAQFTEIATDTVVGLNTLANKTIRFVRPSIVNSSSHTWEFAGSGTNYNALPENGGKTNRDDEQVSERKGRVYCSGTDELGDFKVGTFAKIENRTGNITFTGTVTISEVEFLKLKGGDVVVTGFDASNTLGGANTTDSKLPTQKAVRDFITNNLGPYINKPYSTNPVPRALVELGDNGKISIDQIPPLRPFNIFTVADQGERVSIEGALAGDIAIQQDTSNTFILNNDNSSLFVTFAVDPTLQFTAGDIFTGSITGGKIQATEYRQGVVYQINITNAGSGYTQAPVVTIVGGNPQAGAVEARATCTIANGQVVTVTITTFNGYKGGKGYTTQPTITFTAPGGTGVQAVGNVQIESRLYGNIINNIKMTDLDFIQSSDVPAETINIVRVVNTSATTLSNWVSLSTSSISANNIVSGTIATARLANNSDAANSFTFLRGDQAYAPVLQSIKGAEKRYFARLNTTANASSSQLVFTTNSNTLIGHLVIDNILGIQANTSINGVTTDAGITTVSINNALTQQIPAGTIIEFERGASPLTFDSTFTQGGFVDAIIVSNGGSGFTSGQYFDQPITGGDGTGLKANIIVTNGSISDVTITSAGTGYTSDFSISVAPASVGAGTGLLLAAKINTVNRQYANTAVDIQRVSDLTISADAYGTIGVSRFKKSQFKIGEDGNGSVVLRTGATSGLDADLLDGLQGSYYLNSSNQNLGTLPPERLAGQYGISISGGSAFSSVLTVSTNNPSSNPNPNLFSTGIIADARNNITLGLEGNVGKSLVITLRPGGNGFTVDGGVKQLAFTDSNSMYLRGSGTGVSTFENWGKVWTSNSDGPGTGMDADRLDNRQGLWYQNAININTGIIADNHLPPYQTKKDIKDKLRIISFSGLSRYSVLVPDELLSGSPFSVGLVVNLYNSSEQAVGSIQITHIELNADSTDTFNTNTVITGVLTAGNDESFNTAVTIGTASFKKPFKDHWIAYIDTNADGIPDGTFIAATIESDGGTANLKLGRRDGIASTPGIYFNSSVGNSSYNSAIVASGGTDGTASGFLDVKVVGAGGFTINGSTVWNAASVGFNSTNVLSTATLISAVSRDTSGNFAAGTITAALTGAASLNVLKAGDDMTGSLNITGTSSNLSVGGTATVTGNTILTKNLTVDTNTLFVDATNNSVNVGSTANAVGVKLQVLGSTAADTIVRVTATNGTYDPVIQLAADAGFTSEGFELRYDNNVGDIKFKQVYTGLTTAAAYRFSTGNKTDALTITGNGRVGIFGVANDNFELDVTGRIRATTSITIDSANDNTGAPLYFLGSNGFRNFRIGNQLLTSDVFEITPSTAAGGSTWKTTPAIAVQGTNNRVAINTTNFSGTDTTVSPNVSRNYGLNVQGDININGQVFQNNAAFVTSRWTATGATLLDISRASNVGIRKLNPTFDLHVGGTTGINIENLTLSAGVNNAVLYANSDRQWVDSYGVFKANRNTINESITVPANLNVVSTGPLTINNSVTINITSGAVWSIL